MSSQLFRRAWKIQVGTLDVSNLDFMFEILRTSKPEPNKCTLTILNLSRDHVAELLKRNKPNGPNTKAVPIPVQIEAGYVDNTSVLFSGDLSEVGGHRDFTDRKITLTGQDGGKAYRDSRISQTFGKGTPVSLILQQCAKALGVGLGNLGQFSPTASINGLGSTIPAQLVLDGQASKQLDRVVQSMGLKWSIQSGALQLTQNGKPLNQAAIKISADTGLIGSPEASIDSTVSLGNPQASAPGAPQKVAKPPKPKNTDILKIVTMMIPGLSPGRKIVIESELYNGGYMITECRYRGESWSNTWQIELIARVY